MRMQMPKFTNSFLQNLVTMMTSHQTVTAIVTISNTMDSVTGPKEVTPTKRMKKWKRKLMSEAVLIITNHRPRLQ